MWNIGLKWVRIVSPARHWLTTWMEITCSKITIEILEQVNAGKVNLIPSASCSSQFLDLKYFNIVKNVSSNKLFKSV